MQAVLARLCQATVWADTPASDIPGALAQLWAPHGRALTPHLNPLRQRIADALRPRCGDRLTAPALLAWFLVETGGAFQEELWVVAVRDGDGRPDAATITAVEMVVRGTINQAPVRIAEILRPALASDGDGVIVLHNHPSGDPTPSPEDRACLRRLEDGAAMLRLAVLDFVIVGQGRWVSLRPDGGAPAARAGGWR